MGAGHSAGESGTMIASAVIAEKKKDAIAHASTKSSCNVRDAKAASDLAACDQALRYV
jgi:hypothetical protein